MNIQIEDYFGNDVMKLEFCLKSKEPSKERIAVVEAIGNKFGYNVADIDCDEDGIDYIRLQQVNVDNSEEQEKKELLLLINMLNTQFL